MAQFSEVGVELIVKGSRDFFGTLNKAGGKIAGFGKTVGKVAVAGMAAFGAAAAGVAAASIGAAISFESAWAGVIKTTDGLVDEMGNLTAAGEKVQQGFRDLAKEVPTSVEELLAIGELGGQLGIAQDSLVDFTRTIAAMGEATNLTTEEAATGFAQIANIMQTPQSEIENMGSAVVELGNNFATTERDILTFAQRIAGAGQIAGLTESDVFAIGAAFSSVGVQAEAGGTAVQKVLLAMNQAAIEGGDQLEIFAATAGLSAEDFAQSFEDDAAGAFTDFVEGLGIAGDDAINILSALGLEDQRLVRSFLSLAGAGDLLSDAIDSSSEAFEANTALTKEADQRYQTTASQLKILQNTIKDVAIGIGSFLLPAFNKFVKIITGTIKTIQHLLKWGELMHPSEFIPGFFELPDVVQEIITKAQAFLADFFTVFLPQAIAFLSNLWTTVLWPALQMFAEFVFSTVIPALASLVTWLSQNIPVAVQLLADLWTGTLQPALQAVWEFIQTSVIPALQQIFNWFSQNIPVAVQVLSDIFNSVLKPAIDAIVSAFQTVVSWVQENWPAIQSVIEGVINAIWTVVSTVVGEIVRIWEEEFSKTVTWVQENWPLIQEAISDVLGTIQTIISEAVAFIQNLWLEHGDKVKSLINTIWTIIKGVIEQAMNFIRGAIQAAMFIISGNWEEAWNLIKDTGQNIWNAFQDFMKAAGPKLWEIIRGIVRQVPEIISSIGSKVLEAGRQIVEMLKQGISDAWGAFTSWFRDRLDGLTSWLPWNSPPRNPRSPLRGLRNAGRNIVEEITLGMASAIGQLESAQMGLASALQQATIQTAAMPAAAAAGTNVSVTNQFNTSIDGGMSHAAFETGVQRVIERAIGQAV